MATIPSLTVPPSSSSAVLDRTLAMTVTVNVQLTRPGEFWWGYAHFRYRTIGSPTWTYVPSSTTFNDLTEAQSPYSTYNSAPYTFAGSTFAAGDYEMQVEVSTNVSGGDVSSGWSSSAFFSMGSPPTAPTITSPASGATITTSASTVSYTVPTAQASEQLQVLNGATVEYDSGERSITTATTQTGRSVTFPTNTGSRTLRVRTKSSGGLWSAWASITVTVTWTPPVAPTISSVGVFDVAGVGFSHAIGFTINTGAGSGKPVNYVDVYVRVTGSGATVGTLVGTSPWQDSWGGPFRWYGAKAGVLYDVRAVTRNSDGTTSTSAWTAIGTAVTIKGVLLHTLGASIDQFSATQPTFVFLRYNDDEVTEERDVESALISYAGREFPVVEFGTAGTRSLTVELAHSKGVVQGALDVDKLRAMLEARVVVGYQDRRARSVYGRLKLGTIKDTAYGNTLALTVDVTYPDSSPPLDAVRT